MRLILLLLPLPQPVDLEQHPMMVQFLARFLLMMMQLHGWFRMARALDHHNHYHHQNKHHRQYHHHTATTTLGTYLLLITAVQFHMPFYASRLLANTFAITMTLHVFSDWILLGNTRRAAFVLVSAMVLFRCDLLLLVVTCGLSWLYTRQLTIAEAVTTGVVSVAMTLLVTVPLDSLLWQHFPTWPEGAVLYHNVVLNKSVEYGTSPWHWYVTRALPKAMLLTGLFVPFAVLRLPPARRLFSSWFRPRPLQGVATMMIFDTTWLLFLMPAFGYIALYSFLGHKEMRFLFPVMPLVNLAAAVGCTRIHQLQWPDKEKSPTRIGTMAFGVMVLALAMTFAASTAFLLVSSWNYPGGYALEELVRVVKESEVTTDEVRVYIDVASAMTGVSLFGQRAAELQTPNTRWLFEKGGYEQNHVKAPDRARFTHILTEDPNIDGFQVLAVAQGNPRLALRQLQVVTTDAIYVLGQLP
jgi:alpha-1,6-mannosyltransferase